MVIRIGVFLIPTEPVANEGLYDTNRPHWGGTGWILSRNEVSSEVFRLEVEQIPSDFRIWRTLMISIELKVNCNEVTTSPRRPSGQVSISSYKMIISQASEFKTFLFNIWINQKNIGIKVKLENLWTYSPLTASVYDDCKFTVWIPERVYFRMVVSIKEPADQIKFHCWIYVLISHL